MTPIKKNSNSSSTNNRGGTYDPQPSQLPPISDLGGYQRASLEVPAIGTYELAAYRTRIRADRSSLPVYVPSRGPFSLTLIASPPGLLEATTIAGLLLISP